jgi:hypothetical protein
MAPTPRQHKRVQSTKKTEREGVALIAKIVAEMGHLWNEPQNDFGTDGFVELVDPATQKASNRIVLVQSKATSVAFGDRPISFTCREADLRYWLHGNAPVILVRSHPANGEAYWVSVKDYFAEHPEQRPTRRIEFDRESDRLDESGAERLWDLGRPALDGLYLGTPPVHDVLTTNLLPVETMPARIYTGTAVAATAKLARQQAFSNLEGTWPRAWIIWSGRVYTWHNPSVSSVSALFAGEAMSFPVEDWARSDDEDTQRRFVWLLNAALDEQTRPAMRSREGIVWLAAPPDLGPLEIPVPGGSQTRTVVKRYLKDDGSTKYVRHLGFERSFVRYGDDWYLEITPTYHFTRDGNVEDRFASGHRAGIKRIERHADFRRNVDSLGLILRGDVDLGGLSPDPHSALLEFGEAEQVALETDDEFVFDDSEEEVE